MYATGGYVLVEIIELYRVHDVLYAMVLLQSGAVGTIGRHLVSVEYSNDRIILMVFVDMTVYYIVIVC